jgi:ribosomal subunit interface protein
MKVLIREQGVEMTAALRGHVERRVGIALGRFSDRIGRVTVRFSRASVGCGSFTRCQIDVGLRPLSVRAGDTDGDLFAAVDHASDRVARSVARALDLERPRGGG